MGASRRGHVMRRPGLHGAIMKVKYNDVFGAEITLDLDRPSHADKFIQAIGTYEQAAAMDWTEQWEHAMRVSCRDTWDKSHG